MEWLGQVPEHWDVTRLKHACHVFPSNVDKKSYDAETSVLLCNYTDVYYNDKITAGMEFMPATATPDQIAKFTLCAGDTIITKDSETADDIAISAYVPADLPGVVCGYHLSMVRPMLDTSGAFVKRLFDSVYAKSCFEVRANGLTRVGLGQYEIDNVELPFPPPSEQTAIAAFLDRETAKIDELVAEQQHLIDLLKEKRQAVISHAVTRGLNPKARMKPSGIEWLGDVPEHWEVIKIGLFSRFKGGAGFPDDYQGQTDKELPFFKVGDIINSDDSGVMRQANHSITRETAKELRAYIFLPGTMVFAKVGAALLLKRFRTLGQPSCIDNNMMGMTTDKTANADFMLYVLPLLDFALIVNPGAVPSINEGQISGQRIALPPVDEQEAIIAFLNSETAKLDTLTAEAQRAIDLLQERRTALISAAVTGKIDVRGLVKTEAA